MEEVLRLDNEWLFNEAPRKYRLEALDKLPELLRALTAAADRTADALSKKVSVTKQVASAIASAAASAPAGRR